MGLGIKNVIMTNHMITLITSSTTDHRLMFYPSLYDEFFMKFVILSIKIRPIMFNNNKNH
jgi:hypothetical protein